MSPEMQSLFQEADEAANELGDINIINTVRICKSHVQKNGQNVPEDLAVALQKLSEEGKIPVGFYNATSKFISKQLLTFKKQ